jgi:hypothetical protein
VTIETPVAVEAGDGGASIDVIAEAAGGDSSACAAPRGEQPRQSQVPLEDNARRICSSACAGRSQSAARRGRRPVRARRDGLAIPAASFVFARDERVRLEWPVLGAMDHYAGCSIGAPR